MECLLLGQVIGQCSDVEIGEDGDVTFVNFIPADDCPFPACCHLEVSTCEGYVRAWAANGDMIARFDVTRPPVWTQQK